MKAFRSLVAKVPLVKLHHANMSFLSPRGISVHFKKGLDFKEEKKSFDTSQSLVQIIADAGSNPAWHTKCMVGMDFRSVHMLRALHLWMIHRRILSEDSTEHLQESLFDCFWKDTEGRLREFKVENISIQRYVQEFQTLTFKFFVDLDEAMHPNNSSERLDMLSGSLWRHLYLHKADVPEDVVLCTASYVLSELNDIIDADWKIINETCFKFSPPLYLIRKDNGETITMQDAPENDEVWSKVLNPDGRYFYWNSLTQESTWTPPVSTA